MNRSRRPMQSSQYAPNDSARVGEGRLVQRGRVLSQSLLVARERRRRELGSNLVIVTTTFTSGEGHVVEDGLSQRVRKILAGVPASVSFRDLILALSLSREERQHWTVGNRPIRKNDLRSLHRNSVEAQIQDRSRQKTGLNTVPGFSRVYNKPPLRGAKGTRAQHAGDARNSPPPSFPRTTPSFPRAIRHSRGLRRHSRGRGNPEKNKAHRQTSPSRSEGDACAARRGCPKTTNTPPFEAPNTKTTPPSSPHPLRHSRKPYVIPASLTSFPRTREPREKQSTPFPPKPTPPPTNRPLSREQSPLPLLGGD